MFVPPVMLSHLLNSAEELKYSDTPRVVRMKAAVWALLLFVSLVGKTVLDNQYYYLITSAGASIKGALATAVYNKALALESCNRHSYSVNKSNV